MDTTGVPFGYTVWYISPSVTSTCYLSPLLPLSDEIANLVLSLESYYKAKAKERQSLGGGDKKSGTQKSAEPIIDRGERLSEGRGVKKGVQKSAPVNDDTLPMCRILHHGKIPARSVTSWLKKHRR